MPATDARLRAGLKAAGDFLTRRRPAPEIRDPVDFSDDNFPARAFYERLWYAHAGARKTEHIEGVSLIEMRMARGLSAGESVAAPSGVLAFVRCPDPEISTPGHSGEDRIGLAESPMALHDLTDEEVPCGWAAFDG